MAKKTSIDENNEAVEPDPVAPPFNNQITLEDFPEEYQQAVSDAQARLEQMQRVAQELSEKGFSNEAVQLLTGVIL